MTDTKLAGTLVPGDRIDVNAALDASFEETDRRFYWDELDTEELDKFNAAVVARVINHNSCTTLHTTCGIFAVPDDFPVVVLDHVEGL